MTLRKVFIQITVLVFVALWAYTALNKLFSFELFQTQLGQSPLLKSGHKVISLLVPITEMALVALLLFEKTRQAGLWLSAALLLIFTVYLTIIVSSYDASELPCTCGGFISSMSWTQHIIFNSGLMLLAVLGAMAGNKALQENRHHTVSV